MVAAQGRLGGQRVQVVEAGLRAPAHGQRDGPVELDHRPGQHLGEHPVQVGDLRPVGVGRAERPRVARRDRRLQRVRPAAPAELLGPVQRGQAAVDQQPVPPGPVLVEQQHRLPVGTSPGRQPRRLQLDQGRQAVHLGLGRHQLGQHPGQPDRVRAQCGPHPVVPGGGRVPLVEDQVDDLEHGGQPGRPLRRSRHLERHLLAGQRPLGPDDPLRDGGLGQQVGPGDLGGGQAAEHAQGQRDPGRGREHRVAGGEHQPQEVIVDLVRVGRHEPGG